MKIVIFDSCIFKFSQVLMDHWLKQGHEVQKSVYFNPDLVKWADVVFFDFVENNLMRASHADEVMWVQKNYPRPSDKLIIARAHDIDVWTGNLCRVDWSWVNYLIFVAPHIQEIGLGGIDLNKYPNLKVHLIYHGIDTEKFTLKKNFIKTKKIAVIGNINHQKGPELAFQVLAHYPEYELHINGTGWRNWEKKYVEHIANVNNFKVFFTDRVESINDFLEDKDYLLLTSYKEAFSYVVGEAMAKGITPLIHNFWGSETIWPRKFIWNKISDIRDIIDKEYNSHEIRQFIIDTYPLSKQLSEYDKLLTK